MDKLAMISTLKRVFSEHSISIIKEPTRFENALNDYLWENGVNKETQMWLVFAVKQNIGHLLISVHDSSPSERERVLKVIHRDFVGAGWSKDTLEDVLTAYTTAMGWNPESAVPNIGTIQSILVLDEADVSVPNTTKKGRESFVCGTRISFGKYKWRVLAVRENSMLLLADELTDIGIPYNEKHMEVTWETSSLRIWLNTEFLNRFTSAQQMRIEKKRISAEGNQWYQTDAGNSTEDKVFLFSIQEVVSYFGDSGHLKNRPENLWVDKTTSNGLPCAIDDGYNDSRRTTYKGKETWWWLRSPGSSKYRATYVNANGVIFLNGELAFDDGGTSCVGVRPGVRPAIWLRKKQV